ncbi:unnamed protein product [Clonostachys solani]|uniref:Uncharacterized protein n=1 Tax=Clonostachys solani TaxID=160281 RepID=A0A9P0ER26_9HYPO|nr:unnamed protein product [Clonostachys solani]
MGSLPEDNRVALEEKSAVLVLVDQLLFFTISAPRCAKDEMKFPFFSASPKGKAGHVADAIPLVESTSPGRTGNRAVGSDHVPLSDFEFVKLQEVERMLEDREGWKDRTGIVFGHFMMMVLTELICFMLFRISADKYWWRDQPPSPNPQSVEILAYITPPTAAVVAIVGVIWVLSGLHLLFFVTLGLYVLVTTGSALYALVVVGVSRTNSVCNHDRIQSDCDEALKSTLGAALLKVLFVQCAVCLGLVVVVRLATQEELEAGKSRSEEVGKRTPG